MNEYYSTFLQTITNSLDMSPLRLRCMLTSSCNTVAPPKSTWRALSSRHRSMSLRHCPISSRHCAMSSSSRRTIVLSLRPGRGRAFSSRCLLAILSPRFRVPLVVRVSRSGSDSARRRLLAVSPPSPPRLRSCVICTLARLGLG